MEEPYTDTVIVFIFRPAADIRGASAMLGCLAHAQTPAGEREATVLAQAATLVKAGSALVARLERAFAEEELEDARL